jgi:hypothetical protein
LTKRYYNFVNEGDGEDKRAILLLGTSVARITMYATMKQGPMSSANGDPMGSNLLAHIASVFIKSIASL